MWEPAGIGTCFQEPVVMPERGCAGDGGHGTVCGYASESRHRGPVGIPGLVDILELLGVGSCGYTGPADIEICGYAGQLAVSGSPIRGWQGGKGTAVWKMHGIQLLR